MCIFGFLIKIKANLDNTTMSLFLSVLDYTIKTYDIKANLSYSNTKQLK